MKDIEIPVTDLDTGDRIYNGRHVPLSIASVERNPRGCKGKTHVTTVATDDVGSRVQCYDNCATVRVSVEMTDASEDAAIQELLLQLWEFELPGMWEAADFT